MALDVEDTLPPPTEDQQAQAMERKLAQIKSDRANELKKGLSARMLKMHLTPRQNRLLRKLKAEWGMSVSEHVRRAIDDYLRELLDRGELIDEDDDDD